MALSVEGTSITPLALSVFVHEQRMSSLQTQIHISGQCQHMKNLLLLLPKARTGLLSVFIIWKMKVYYSFVAFLSYPLFTLQLFNTIQQSQQIQLSVSELCLRNHARRTEVLSLREGYVLNNLVLR